MTRGALIPLNAVAARYRVSRVAIKKWCARDGIELHKVGTRGDNFINTADIPTEWRIRD